jgi:hypothetical protein
MNAALQSRRQGAISRGWVLALAATLGATAFTAWWTDDAQDAAAVPGATATATAIGIATAGIAGVAGTGTAATAAIAGTGTATATAARASRVAQATRVLGNRIESPQAPSGAVRRLPERAPWPEPAPAAVAAWGVPQALPALANPAARPASTAPIKLAAPGPAAAASTPTALVAPTAPMPDYRYAGRITTEGSRRAMLVTPQGTLVVGEKDTIGGQWRVDRISDDSVWLTWLPGGLPQRLLYTS